MYTVADVRASDEAEATKKAVEDATIRGFVHDAFAEEEKVDGLTAEQIAAVEKRVEQENEEAAKKAEEFEKLVASVVEENENAPYNVMFGKVLEEIHAKEKQDAEKQALANIKGCLAKYKA
ncbi:MAG: hypothetical protein PHH22_02035 [Clostridia bacterium]|nr:hypothetical protein [Clostridia bacterium]